MIKLEYQISCTVHSERQVAKLLYGDTSRQNSTSIHFGRACINKVGGAISNQCTFVWQRLSRTTDKVRVLRDDDHQIQIRTGQHKVWGAEPVAMGIFARGDRTKTYLLCFISSEKKVAGSPSDLSVHLGRLRLYWNYHNNCEYTDMLCMCVATALDGDFLVFYVSVLFELASAQSVSNLSKIYILISLVSRTTTSNYEP